MIQIRYPLLKAWSLMAHTPTGPAILRNPPPSHFRAGDDQFDIPAFAHDGQGNTYDGQWVEGKHGELVWQTGLGDFRHGIDAVIHHVGEFLAARGINIDPKEVVQHAINEYNDTHTNPDSHQLSDITHPEWRKIIANSLPPGDATRDMTNRPSRTHGGSKITMLTNKNYDQTPVGRFLESYYIPFNKQLMHALEDLGIPQAEIKQALSFTKYPYLYAQQTAPEGYIRSHAQQHPGEVDSGMMGHAPEGYYGDQTPVHTWSVTHHLPDIFFYPNLKENLQKKGKQPTALYQAAHAMIDEALQGGMEHIPNINVTINQGTMANPDMINRPLHEILQTPDLRQALIKDMAHVPAMMFLFGRSGQGDFQNLYNHMMQKYGATEDALSPEQQAQFLTAGEKGGKGMHESAKRIFALARASGASGEQGRSNFGDHQITADELQAAGVHYSDKLMGQVDRFRTIIEALANHQASYRGHNVQMGVGDIPTEPLKPRNVINYPTMNTETGQYDAYSLEPHMDAYLHDIHDFAPTQGFDPSLTVTGDAGLPPSQPSLTSVTSPPMPSPVTPVPSTYPATPMQQFQQVRPQIGQYSPADFRQLLEMVGRRRPQPRSNAPLTELEARAQASMADPQQRMLAEYYKSNDVMDRVMAVLKGRGVL